MFKVYFILSICDTVQILYFFLSFFLLLVSSFHFWWKRIPTALALILHNAIAAQIKPSLVYITRFLTNHYNISGATKYKWQAKLALILHNYNTTAAHCLWSRLCYQSLDKWLSAGRDVNPSFPDLQSLFRVSHCRWHIRHSVFLHPS